jgi:hypothetical protein
MKRTLSSDIELFAAALSQVRIAVVQRTANDIPVFIDVGTIEKYTRVSVKVNGAYYMRGEREFHVEVTG